MPTDAASLGAYVVVILMLIQIGRALRDDSQPPSPPDIHIHIEIGPPLDDASD